MLFKKPIFVTLAFSFFMIKQKYLIHLLYMSKHLSMSVKILFGDYFNSETVFG